MGFILCVIPGIYIHYVYYWVEFIIAENPEMNYNEVMELSKEMTKGNKLDLFGFDLSWFGWILLTIITCGLSSIYVTPFINRTRISLYDEYKEQYQSTLLPIEEE
jgi:uncharacterized membrane protein